MFLDPPLNRPSDTEGASGCGDSNSSFVSGGDSSSGSRGPCADCSRLKYGGSSYSSVVVPAVIIVAATAAAAIVEVGLTEAVLLVRSGVAAAATSSSAAPTAV